MRPILVELPSKLFFVVAIVLAIVLFARDWIRRRLDHGYALSSTPGYLLAGAWLILGLRGGSWLPAPDVFSQPWLPVPIYSYGVMLGTSMIVGWFVVMRFAKQDGIGQEPAGAIYMWTAVWSIVGARLLYVIVQHREFDGVVDLFKVWKGGLVAYGGMIGGFVASWYGCRKRKISLLRWADVAAPAVVLGTAITRVGCLLFGCDYGKQTAVPWAIRFPKGRPAWDDHVSNFGLASDAARSLPVHPTQVYEMLAGLCIFGLLVLMRRWRKFSGQVFVAWVIGYGILRPIIELYRDDKQRGTVGPLSTSQFIGLTSVFLATGLLIHLLRRYRQDAQGMRLWELPLEPASAPAASPNSRGNKRRKSRS